MKRPSRAHTVLLTIAEIRDALHRRGARAIQHDLNQVRERLSWTEGPRVDQLLEALFPDDPQLQLSQRPDYLSEYRTMLRSPAAVSSLDAWALQLVRHACPVRETIAWQRLIATALGQPTLDLGTRLELGAFRMARPEAGQIALNPLSVQPTRSAFWGREGLHQLVPMVDALQQPSNPNGKRLRQQFEDAVAAVKPDGATSWGTAEDQSLLAEAVATYAMRPAQLEPVEHTWMMTMLQHSALEGRWPRAALRRLLQSEDRSIRLLGMHHLGDAGDPVTEEPLEGLPASRALQRAPLPSRPVREALPSIRTS